MDRIWIGITTVLVASRIETDNPERQSLGMSDGSRLEVGHSWIKISLTEAVV
jgi:hypothetical protein